MGGERGSKVRSSRKGDSRSREECLPSVTHTRLGVLHINFGEDDL